ncbi:hypothetical protein [Paramicrobacterium chengjingii]|uniref:hypothetical protein n=1 Tax=Paramicrobacterium chengjingii TaxID=2769067 RepID=UPI001FD143F7|nr:hypothetical protein [Microbacterium chengjingii]
MCQEFTSNGCRLVDVLADRPLFLVCRVYSSPLSAAPALPESGTDDGIYLYDGDAASATIVHVGSGKFIVQEDTAESLSFGLLINEIGTYSGTVPVSADLSVITVTADGDWTIAIG